MAVNPNPPLSLDDMNSVMYRVKSFDAPKYTIELEYLNQYNKQRILPLKIEYDPIGIIFHDDRSNLVQDFWKKVYNYYYKDGMFKADKGDSYSTTVSDRIVENPQMGGSIKPFVNTDDVTGHTYNNFGYNMYNKIETNNLFSYLSLYLVEGGQYSRIDLVNPYIQSMQHDTFSQEDHSTLAQITTNWGYETVVYKENGLVTEEQRLKGILEDSGIFFDGWQPTDAPPVSAPKNRITDNTGEQEKFVNDLQGVFSDDIGGAAETGAVKSTTSYINDYYEPPEKKEVEEGKSYVDDYIDVHRNILTSGADFGADAKAMDEGLDRALLAQSAGKPGYSGATPKRGINMNEKVVKFVKTARTTGLENRYIRGAVSKPDGGIGSGGRFKTSANQKATDAAYDTELAAQAAILQQEGRGSPARTVGDDGFVLTRDGWVLSGNQTPSLAETIKNANLYPDSGNGKVLLAQLGKMGVDSSAFSGASGQVFAQKVTDLLTGRNNSQEQKRMVSFLKLAVNMGSPEPGETAEQGAGYTNEQIQVLHQIANMSEQDATALSSAMVAGGDVVGNKLSPAKARAIDKRIREVTGTGKYADANPGTQSSSFRHAINSSAQRRGVTSPGMSRAAASSTDPDAIGAN